MKVLMLGWEYPPHISGGLGTACHGLTTELANQGVHIDFVVPRLYGDELAAHMRLTGVDQPFDPDAPPPESVFFSLPASTAASPLVRHAIPAYLMPYMREPDYNDVLELRRRQQPMEPLALAPLLQPEQGSDHYGDTLFDEVLRYAAEVVHRFGTGHWDVVHAHDWMTYPAAMQLAALLGIPLVAHVHSLEQDRSGEHPDPRIFAIEHAAIASADCVVAVSHYTRSRIARFHQRESNVAVVHNGVYTPSTVAAIQRKHRWDGPVVLYLGRITYQKGPDYFVEAAARVLSHSPDVRFVMAGAGDMVPQILAQVERLGIAEHFVFPGFVKGSEVEDMFAMADVYVMPSVSEPFGISALEAMAYNRPVIVSRQSGISEVLRHALKVDFWNVDELADKILALVNYPELREEIVEHGREEVRRFHWDQAAKKVVAIYQTLSNQQYSDQTFKGE
jgi:glycogen(starch) synthase